jgi:hypothetical protein
LLHLLLQAEELHVEGLVLALHRLHRRHVRRVGAPIIPARAACGAPASAVVGALAAAPPSGAAAGLAAPAAAAVSALRETAALVAATLAKMLGPLVKGEPTIALVVCPRAV